MEVFLDPKRNVLFHPVAVSSKMRRPAEPFSNNILRVCKYQTIVRCYERNTQIRNQLEASVASERISSSISKHKWPPCQFYYYQFVILCRRNGCAHKLNLK